ncbi:hypothetical protein ABMA27_010449 [Loxostege sticticalis]|uniref:PHD-type domain-containing protein n=1 Tax=Loxostege sticticalis TaxID=481309 RepID=A0ABR3H5R5_LOXSC
MSSNNSNNSSGAQEVAPPAGGLPACAGCRRGITNRRWLQCCKCAQYWDLECANVPECRFFNTMTKEHRAKWTCPECECRLRMGGNNSETPVKPQTDDLYGNVTTPAANPEAGSSAVAGLERTVTELRLELNGWDQDALLADLEIGQLPEAKGENVMHSVIVLAGRLGVTLDERDVVFAERVGAPPAEAGGAHARRVVLRLARRQLRDDLLQAARVRRGLTGEGGARVFVNERLTHANRQLFRHVREECLVQYTCGTVIATRSDCHPSPSAAPRLGSTFVGTLCNDSLSALVMKYTILKYIITILLFKIRSISIYRNATYVIVLWYLYNTYT